MSGASIFGIWGDQSGDLPTRQQIIAALQPVGAEKTSGKLPAPEVPAGDVQRMKRVVSVFERNSSVNRTARKLKLRSRWSATTSR